MPFNNYLFFAIVKHLTLFILNIKHGHALTVILDSASSKI